MMYAITGITGKVGSELARTLLAAGEPVRAVVRDAKKGQEWAAVGCKIALAKMEEASALTDAFIGATAVFILPPSEFDPEPGYPEARAVINNVVEALRAAKPRRVLCLSTIGADAKQDNLLSQRGVMEEALRKLQIPLTILRPAWFIDNAAWEVVSARDTGLIHSFLQPIAKDVGRLAAKLIREDWTGTRIVELEWPNRITPNDLADSFARVIGKPVCAVPVPRESWDELFRSQGMRNPEPRMRMLDGFNEGWIEFEDGGSKAIKGSTNALAVIAALVTNTEA